MLCTYNNKSVALLIHYIRLYISNLRIIGSQAVSSHQFSSAFLHIFKYHKRGPRSRLRKYLSSPIPCNIILIETLRIQVTYLQIINKDNKTHTL